MQGIQVKVTPNSSIQGHQNYSRVFTMAAPRQPLRTLKINKGNKKPNMFKGPYPEAPPGKKVRFQDGTIQLPIHGNGINLLVGD